MLHIYISLGVFLLSLVAKIAVHLYDKNWQKRIEQSFRFIKKENLIYHFQGYTKWWNTITVFTIGSFIYFIVSVIVNLFVFYSK